MKNMKQILSLNYSVIFLIIQAYCVVDVNSYQKPASMDEMLQERALKSYSRIRGNLGKANTPNRPQPESYKTLIEIYKQRIRPKRLSLKQLGQSVIIMSGVNDERHMSISNSGNRVALGAGDYCKIAEQQANGSWEDLWKSSDVNGYDVLDGAISMNSDGTKISVAFGGEDEYGTAIIFAFDEVSNKYWTSLGDPLYSSYSSMISNDGLHIITEARDPDNINLFELTQGGIASWSYVASIPMVTSGEGYSKFTFSGDGKYIATSAMNNSNSAGKAKITVYQRSGNSLSQRGQPIDADITSPYGATLSLISGGSRIAIGTGTEVTICDYQGGSWVVSATIPKNSLDGPRGFGASLALADNGGNQLVIGSPLHNNGRGRMVVYVLQKNEWVQVDGDIVGDKPYSNEGAVVTMARGGKYVATMGKTGMSGGQQQNSVRVFEIVNV